MRSRLAAAAVALLAGCGSKSDSPVTGLPPKLDPAVCVSNVRSAQFGSAGDLVIQDLGEHSVNELVTFMVTTGTTSFSLVSQEVDGSAVDYVSVTGYGAIWNTVVPDLVKTPAGVLYYDDNQGYDPAAISTAVYWGLTPVSGTFTVPNTSPALAALRANGQLPEGKWSFRANDWANECAQFGVCDALRNTGRYHLHAVTKTAPLSATGTLDLEVYLLTDPSNAISTAAAAGSSARLQRWAASVAHFLGNGGLNLGAITFHDLPTAVHARYPNGSVDITNDGPCDPLSQLFASSYAPGRGVSLFLVEELVDQTPSGSGTIVGIDGSIPGPSGFPGTVASGAAVGLFGELGRGTCPPGSISLSTCGPDVLAYVAAHEIGHWLGLYHTSESDCAFWDSISDTPRCTNPSSSCLVNGCSDGSNLMFWLLDPARSVGSLSSDQGQVIRLNPAVR